MKSPKIEPPPEIDGARVIEWAWSGEQPFGEVHGAEPVQIYGLVIATYDDKEYYRFSCDSHWNTQQDGSYTTVAEAKRQLPEQYKKIEANWIVR